MKSRNVFSLAIAALFVASCSTISWAQPTIDGNASVADGYTVLSTQNTKTQFGDVGNDDPIIGAGSEIDRVYGKVENGRLYVVIAGNLETNFNKLDIYLDTDSGSGVSTIDPNVLPDGVDSFCCGAGNSTFDGSAGLTFDAGFTADYFLTFTHGFESLGGPNARTFYAATSHYADLTQGTSGDVYSLGMQLAQQGLPQVLRGRTTDHNVDGSVDSADRLIWETNWGADPNTITVNRLTGDNDSNGLIDALDFLRWQRDAGFTAATASLTEFPFAPQSGDIDNSVALLGPSLPGNLSQGDLIDQNYALDPNGGGCTGDEGDNCAAPELEFTLPIAASDPTNTRSHRDMNNGVNLQMAFDNSNTIGVGGGQSAPWATTFDPNTGIGDPNMVTTGIEFSIPLEFITPSGDPNDLSSINLMAFVNNGDHNYLSNQVSGTGILLGNLGGDGTGAFTGTLSGLDFGLIPGDQFVTLAVPLSAAVSAVPEPSTLSMLLLGAGLMVRRRKQ